MFEFGMLALAIGAVGVFLLACGAISHPRRDGEGFFTAGGICLFASAFLGFVLALASDTLLTTILLGALFGVTVVFTVVVIVAGIAMRDWLFIGPLMIALLLNSMTGMWLYNNLWGAPGVV